MEQEFTDISEFRDSDISLKHELGYLSCVSCWCFGSILVSNTRCGRFEPFTVVTNSFVAEFGKNI